MVGTILVETQVDDGQTLIERLAQEGIPVTAACWLKESDGGFWYLYLASPVVDARGAHWVYRRLLPIVRGMPQPFGIDPSAVKAIETSDPVARAVRDLNRRFPAQRPLRFDADELGGVSVQGGYLYPPLPARDGPETAGARKQSGGPSTK
jgi:hypothetical protein